MNNFANISVYQNNNFLEIKLNRTLQLQDLENIYKNIESYISNASRKFFINLSAEIKIDRESKNYLQNILIPSLIEKGLRQGAFVLPEDTLEKLDWQNILTNLRKENSKFLVRIFNKEINAREWINN